jgi:RNA-binding protein
MKQVHNIRIRVIDRDQTIINTILHTIMTDANVEREDITITFNDSDDELIVGELWAQRQQPVRRILKTLQEKLPAQDKQHIATHASQYVDTSTHCFIRLDKLALTRQDYMLAKEGTAVQVRLNIAAFPATKDKAIVMVSELFNQ